MVIILCEDDASYYHVMYVGQGYQNRDDEKCLVILLYISNVPDLKDGAKHSIRMEFDGPICDTSIPLLLPLPDFFLLAPLLLLLVLLSLLVEPDVDVVGELPNSMISAFLMLL